MDTYRSFVDPSGGANDSMCLAIAHAEGETIVIDALREERAPFDPDRVTREFTEVLRRYRVRSVQGDRYGGEWPRERFREHGIEYRTCKTPSTTPRAPMTISQT